MDLCGYVVPSVPSNVRERLAARGKWGKKKGHVHLLVRRQGSSPRACPWSRPAAREGRRRLRQGAKGARETMRTKIAPHSGPINARACGAVAQQGRQLAAQQPPDKSSALPLASCLSPPRSPASRNASIFPIPRCAEDDFQQWETEGGKALTAAVRPGLDLSPLTVRRKISLLVFACVEGGSSALFLACGEGMRSTPSHAPFH